MQKYELQETDGGVRVHAMGGTRAGLVISAVQGLTAALKPAEANSQEDAKTLERPFAKKAESFEALLGQLLADALSQAVADKEAYEHARFDLITDREAKGAVVGRPTSAFGATFSAVRMTAGSVKRAETGWEAEFTLTS